MERIVLAASPDDRLNCSGGRRSEGLGEDGIRSDPRMMGECIDDGGRGQETIEGIDGRSCGSGVVDHPAATLVVVDVLE